MCIRDRCVTITCANNIYKKSILIFLRNAEICPEVINCSSRMPSQEKENFLQLTTAWLLGQLHVVTASAHFRSMEGLVSEKTVLLCRWGSKTQIKIICYQRNLWGSNYNHRKFFEVKVSQNVPKLHNGFLKVVIWLLLIIILLAVSYTHLTLPTKLEV